MSKKSDNPNFSEGFIRLPRSLLESQKWNELRFRYQKLFLFILAKAQYVPYVYKHDGIDIQLMPGDLCISMRRLVDQFNRSTKFKDEKIDLPFLQRAVLVFSKLRLTDTRTDTGVMIISVVYPGIYDSKVLTTDTPISDRPIQKRYTHLKEESKKDKKSHPSIPSKNLTDDFSFEKEKEKEKEPTIEVIEGVYLTQTQIDECITVKGDIEKVKQAMRAIQKNPKRKYTINDWPMAIANWAIEDEVKTRVRRNIDYTEKLCREFQEYNNGNGWKCYMYNDRKKDQRGILFESHTPYNEAFFVALVDGELTQKCDDFIRRKNMRKKK